MKIITGNYVKKNSKYNIYKKLILKKRFNYSKR